MPTQIEKVYEPQRFEPAWAQWWIENGIFKASAKNTGRTFSIVIPPPNVTGVLHMGHMLNHTEHRRGRPLAPHARRQHAVAARHRPRRHRDADGGGAAACHRRHSPASELGREEFEKRVWEWKAQSGGTIKKQMIRLGASCDWSRERFTLDPGLSRAVRETFVRLYEKGLIYRGEYMVNWCPRCFTAISDLETVHEETQGICGTSRYPVDRHGSKTRGGDHAAGDDARRHRRRRQSGRRALQAICTARQCCCRLMNREIPIILDTMADPKFGTGVVKVTPAHDPNDFEAGRRHKLAADQSDRRRREDDCGRRARTPDWTVSTRASKSSPT